MFFNAHEKSQEGEGHLTWHAVNYYLLGAHLPCALACALKSTWLQLASSPGPAPLRFFHLQERERACDPMSRDKRWGKWRCAADLFGR